MRTSMIVLVLALAPVIRAQAPTPVGRPDTAKLTFRWPQTVSARVDVHRYRERHIGGKHDTTDVNLSYRMNATRAGEEYVIRFDDFRFEDLSGPAATGSPEASVVIQRLGEFMPSYRVSSAGEFARLESPERVRAFIDSIWAAVTPKNDPPNPQLKQMVGTLTSDVVLEMAAAQEWNAIVGTWIEGQLEVGQAYVTSGEEPIPVFQNAVVKFDYEFAALRRMPCDSVTSPKARDCVELQMVAKPDSAALRHLLSRFMSAIVQDTAQEVGFAELDIENVVILVARPESLLPVHLTVSKQVTGTVREKGKTEKIHQVDVKEQRYSYQP